MFLIYEWKYERKEKLIGVSVDAERYFKEQGYTNYTETCEYKRQYGDWINPPKLYHSNPQHLKDRKYYTYEPVEELKVKKVKQIKGEKK